MLRGLINDGSRRITLLNRREATEEEEATLRSLEEAGWKVVEWRDCIAPSPGWSPRKEERC